MDRRIDRWIVVDKDEVGIQEWSASVPVQVFVPIMNTEIAVIIVPYFWFLL